MFGDIVQFLLNILFTLFGAALILRCWLQYARVHPYHPVAQGIAQATNWLVHPLRRFIPGFLGIDWASLVAAWLTAVVYILLMVAVAGFNALSALPAALGMGVLMVLRWALTLVVWITLIQVVMSWVNPMAPMMSLLQAITGPLLNPIRRVLPTLGGFDFSPLVLLIIAQIGLMVIARVNFNLFGF